MTYPTLRRSFRLVLVLALALGLTAAFPALAQRGDDAERASKNGKTAGTIDGVDVVVEYGRPKVKGRTLWGDLVPYGEVWRTGADEATTLMVSGDVTLQGESLPAGTYSLFTIPAEDGEWTVVVNEVAKQWGAYRYDESKDVLRVKAAPAEGEMVEELDFVIDGSDLVLRWGTLRLPVTIAKAE